MREGPLLQEYDPCWESYSHWGLFCWDRSRTIEGRQSPDTLRRVPGYGAILPRGSQPYYRTDPGTGRRHPLKDEDWPNNG